ncbi:MAG: hypothetical protein NVSMB47_12950 [Polyangiales bacterium]
MGFWQRYRSSLKPLAVEEPIDVAWHRLLGYAVARAALPTPISADAITVAAILVGIGSGVSIAVPFAHHLLVGALLCTFSAVLDCADGQLARLRKTSSNWGRMLDGTCDLIVMTAVVIGSIIHLRAKGEPWWFWPIAAATIPCCTFHFGHYDHYKNVYMRLTEPSLREGEDLETALARKREAAMAERPGAVIRAVWWLYIFYVSSQTNYIRSTDPYTSARLGLMPAYDPDRAAIYRKHALGPMRLWRTLFGLGTHVFTFSLALAFDRLELYVLFRFGLLNLLCYGFALPWQRRASKAAFEELGLRLPDQRGWDRSESPAAA